MYSFLSLYNELYTNVISTELNMPKKISAIKKAQVSARNRLRNRIYKSTIKTFTKKYFLSLQSLNNNSQEVLFNLSNLYSIIDKAVKRRVLHKNKGARKKASLAQAMKKRFSK